MGVTDYLSIDNYLYVVDRQRQGRIPRTYIFPNVEIRLSVGTQRGSAVNAHLLFSPQDQEHPDRIRTFLQDLNFEHLGEKYRCRRQDLIRLGRAVARKDLTEDQAYAQGVNQFKVNLNDLTSQLRASRWLKSNCLVAVAAAHDGASGVTGKSDSMWALREEIQNCAEIIFSANPADSEYWSGRRGNLAELESMYGGLKPCLHGSDAHNFEQVGRPDQDRYCWVKGDLSFETLRHACIDPEMRVSIGNAPPRGALGINCIKSVGIEGTSFMVPSIIPINPGLVAIIGARGSGKTALADVLAIAAGDTRPCNNEHSFAGRAKDYLGRATARATWENGAESSRKMYEPDEEQWSSPDVQYLSQQFVEQLCSSSGVSHSLLIEIQKVVFNCHSLSAREGTQSFDELLAIRSSEAIERRSRFVDQLERAIEDHVSARRLKADLPGVEKELTSVIADRTATLAELSTITFTGGEDRIRRYEDVKRALDTRRKQAEAMQSQVRGLKLLRDEVTHLSSRGFDEWLNKLKAKHVNANLCERDWKLFTITFTGDVVRFLDTSLIKVEGECASLLGREELPATPPGSDVVSNLESNDLLELDVATLDRELRRLTDLIGVDRRTIQKISLIESKLAEYSKRIEALELIIASTNSSNSSDSERRDARRNAYRNVFQAIVDLQDEYAFLYSPLADKLQAAGGSMSRLSFNVRRYVDIRAWAKRGESLLDLRKDGPFRGRDTLLLKATERLREPWEHGTPEEVTSAMLRFLSEDAKGIGNQRPEALNSSDWLRDLYTWVYDTEHISVDYSVSYDGVPVERLSPGTRGIVLLLLYLAIDETDDRPLVIDQPEENLDPRSVFDELVGHFREARSRRQVVIVTHNANLVVNTDADQVIVARIKEQSAGQLPILTYEAGGLECPSIRRAVCEILEGGERAFRARARRLRLGVADPPPSEAA